MIMARAVSGRHGREPLLRRGAIDRLLSRAARQVAG
jgi:hypothetical protein